MHCQPPHRARSPMGRLLALTCFAMLIAAPGSKAAVTPEQVAAAIEKGKAYLYSKEAKGRWDEKDHLNWKVDKQGNRIPELDAAFGGYTALCTYALLASGENPQDPRLISAIDFLKNTEIVSIYSIGLRCQVWYLLPDAGQNPRKKKDLLERDLKLLREGINTEGASRGFWNYCGEYSPRNRADQQDQS